jgi:hypothetical protein
VKRTVSMTGVAQPRDGALELNLISAAAATGRTVEVTATPPLPLCRSGSDAARLGRAQHRSTARLLGPRRLESASERRVQPPMTCRAVGLNWAVGLKRKPRRRLVQTRTRVPFTCTEPRCQPPSTDAPHPGWRQRHCPPGSCRVGWDGAVRAPPAQTGGSGRLAPYWSELFRARAREQIAS